MKTKLPFLNPEFLKSRIIWSINLRWIAVVITAFSVFIARYLLEFTIPYKAILIILTSMIILNFIYTISFKRSREYSVENELKIIFAHIIIDLVLLTLLIHYSGGMENPFYLFYFFHLLIASILFPPFISFLTTTLIFILFAGLVLLEAKGILAHYTLYEVKCYTNMKNISVLLTAFGSGIFITSYIMSTFISSYRKIKVQIDKKNQELEQKNIENTKFFNFASHELKSPIIAIKSTLDAIIASFEKQIPEQIISLIKRSSDRSGQLLSMITELLDISRKQINAGNDDIHQFNINDIINQVIQHADSVIQSKHLDVTIKLDENIPDISEIKYDYIQILTNLIFNAAYYSMENGKLTIISKLDEKKTGYNISITDTGIGIAKDDQIKIFTEFYRAENAKKEVKFGTGLGLSLVKQLIESKNGEINVVSELDKGSTFTIYFHLLNKNKEQKAKEEKLK